MAAAKYEAKGRKARTKVSDLRKPEAAKLAPRAMEPQAEPRVANRSLRQGNGDSRKPSEKLAERQKQTEEARPLSEKLTMAAAAFPEGSGTVGRALKAGMSGAAAGATLGEAISQMRQEKAQRGEPVEPKALSEKVMGRTTIADAQAKFGTPEMQQSFRKRMKELKDTYGKKPRPKGRDTSSENKA